MPNNGDRIIGNEIRRVQDDVRRSVDDAREQERRIEKSTQEDSSRTYQEGRRFIDQTTRNKLTDIAENSTEGVVDAGELVEEINSREDLEAIEQTTAKEMSFPLLVFSVAVLVDAFDIAGTLTPGVMTLVNAILSIFLLFWFKGKIDESFVENSENIARTNRRMRRYRALANTAGGKQLTREVKRRFIKKFGDRFAKQILLKKFWRYAILSLVYILQIFVLQSLFVLVVWKQQTKMVKAYVSFVEKVSNLLDTIDSYEAKLARTLNTFDIGLAENRDSDEI